MKNKYYALIKDKYYPMIKSKWYVLPSLVLILLISFMGCSAINNNTVAVEKDSNPFFTKIETVKIEDFEEPTDEEPLLVAPVAPLSAIINESKLDIIEDDFPEFYRELKNILINYMSGKPLSLVNVFLQIFSLIGFFPWKAFNTEVPVFGCLLILDIS